MATPEKPNPSTQAKSARVIVDIYTRVGGGGQLERQVHWFRVVRKETVLGLVEAVGNVLQAWEPYVIEETPAEEPSAPQK